MNDSSIKRWLGYALRNKETLCRLLDFFRPEDLENGLLIDDPRRELLEPRSKELEAIFAHTQRIDNFKDLETLADYPPAVAKFLRRVSRVRIERLLYRIL